MQCCFRRIVGGSVSSAIGNKVGKISDIFGVSYFAHRAFIVFIVFGIALQFWLWCHSILFLMLVNDNLGKKHFFPFGDGISAKLEMICKLAIVTIVFFLIIQYSENIRFVIGTMFLIGGFVFSTDSKYFCIDFYDVPCRKVFLLQQRDANFLFLRIFRV